MMKLKRYLKPYIGFALAAIVLMFCQAAVDLNLPNLMSDIVNVGIQQGGITEAAPKAVSAEGLQLMSAFMSEEDRALAQSQYVLAEQTNMTADEWDRFVTDWPKVSDTDVYRQIPNLDDSTQAQLDSAFSRASYALMTVVKDLAEQSGQDIAAGDTDSKAMDMSKLGELVPMLAMLPQGMVDDAIAAAAATPESMLSQTAAVFTKGFYMQLGADTDAMQTSYIFRTGGKMLLMALLLAVCAISVGFCGSRMGAGIARDLRRDIFAKVTSFTNNEYDKFGTASLITRSTNDVTQVQGLVTMGLRIMCYAPIIGIGGTIMALSKSVSMAWVIALAVVLILGLICTISAIAMPRFKIMQQLVDKLNLVSRENLSGMMVIRAFATQDFEEKRFDKANKDLADNNLFVFRAMATMMPVMMLVMNGVSLLIVWVGGHQIADSAMQVGDMMAFIQYTMQIIMSFLMISMMFVMVPRATVSAGRIADVLASESSVQDAPQPRHLPEKVKGLVQFNDVSFHYEGADENVLEHVTFTARPGETTAFIGSTGSGKSTLLRTFNKMYSLYPEQRAEGEILLDGDNILTNTQDIALLRAKVGMVFQKPTPFPMSIYDNIAFGVRLFEKLSRADMDERVQWALTKAALWNETKDKLHQSGYSLSGGQQQRLCIARGIAIRPEVLLLDEPCSALDPISTGRIEELITELKQDYTVVIVTHNMQQAARCSDHTAFMYLGELIEFSDTDALFTRPAKKQTEDYITGRYG